MNRKEYLKNYRKQNRKKYKEYQKKYYAKLKSEKRTPTCRINRARKYIKDNIYKNENEECYSFDGDIFELLEILGDDNNE